MTDSGFRLKGSVVTTILLEIQFFSLNDIVYHLKEKIDQVPHFFNQAPIIIDISKMKRGITLEEFETLIQSVSGLGLGVIGWRCDPENLPVWKSSVTIPLLPASKARAISNAATPKEEVSPDVVVKTVVEERLVPQSTKVISKPIRSGQQVYAEGDLIVLAQVSAGAEVLADGNIHVYGALRGRALAGVKGDVEARIFCKSMEAELVSIAGNFMLTDALQDIVWKDSAQVLLVDDNLEIAPL
ncbi:septum site-determining protein MinC [Marinomonas sp. A79]|uniref:Probable septum site-determining protein MinC n=1 Tax=Marinomonas vulgaris TaxID=2823372 RepID=A0ABS5H8I9_9GAMM|nr:septum site-determining protein MinC [Marinomonas vulgaris]MBR7888016.1 septum site-determining protein MinC [Marinomonas vulgaris]